MIVVRICMRSDLRITPNKKEKKATLHKANGARELWEQKETRRIMVRSVFEVDQFCLYKILLDKLLLVWRFSGKSSFDCYSVFQLEFQFWRFSKQILRSFILGWATMSLKKIKNKKNFYTMKNIAREIELKYGIHCCDACVLLSKPLCSFRENWNFHTKLPCHGDDNNRNYRCFTMLIIVLVCTGQHAEKQQPKQCKQITKHGPNTKETVKKKREKKTLRRERQTFVCMNFNIFFLLFYFFFVSSSLHFSVFSSFVCLWVRFVCLPSHECLVKGRKKVDASAN